MKANEKFYSELGKKIDGSVDVKQIHFYFNDAGFVFLFDFSCPDKVSYECNYGNEKGIVKNSIKRIKSISTSSYVIRIIRSVLQSQNLLFSEFSEVFIQFSNGNIDQIVEEKKSNTKDEKRAVTGKEIKKDTDMYGINPVMGDISKNINHTLSGILDQYLQLPGNDDPKLRANLESFINEIDSVTNSEKEMYDILTAGAKVYGVAGNNYISQVASIVLKQVISIFRFEFEKAKFKTNQIQRTFYLHDADGNRPKVYIRLILCRDFPDPKHRNMPNNFKLQSVAVEPNGECIVDANVFGFSPMYCMKIAKDVIDAAEELKGVNCFVTLDDIKKDGGLYSLYSVFTFSMMITSMIISQYNYSIVDVDYEIPPHIEKIISKSEASSVVEYSIEDLYSTLLIADDALPVCISAVLKELYTLCIVGKAIMQDKKAKNISMNTKNDILSAVIENLTVGNTLLYNELLQQASCIIEIFQKAISDTGDKFLGKKLEKFVVNRSTERLIIKTNMILSSIKDTSIHDPYKVKFITKVIDRFDSLCILKYEETIEFKKDEIYDRLLNTVIKYVGITHAMAGGAQQIHYSNRTRDEYSVTTINSENFGKEIFENTEGYVKDLIDITEEYEYNKSPKK